MNFESPYTDIPMRLTVRENLEVFARLYGVADWRERIAQLARELRLEDLLDRPYGKLSAGRRRASASPRRCSTPRAAAARRADRLARSRHRRLGAHALEAYRGRRGATILLASHNMAEVERLSDRVIMLEKGRMLADETPAELIRRFGRATLEEVFLDIARRRGAGGHAAGAAQTDGGAAMTGTVLRAQTGPRASAGASAPWCCAIGT